MWIRLTNPVSFLAVLLGGADGWTAAGDGDGAGHAAGARRGRLNYGATWDGRAVWAGAVVVLEYDAAALFFAGYLHRGQARWMFVAAGVLLLLGIVVTLVIEVPMNKQIASWDAGAVPAGWAEVRERWLAFHNVRTGMGIGALVCALVGLVRG